MGSQVHLCISSVQASTGQGLLCALGPCGLEVDGRAANTCDYPVSSLSLYLLLSAWEEQQTPARSPSQDAFNSVGQDGLRAGRQGRACAALYPWVCSDYAESSYNWMREH